MNYNYFFPGCTCNAEGSVDNNCDVATGHCFCHSNVVGDSCDECATGSFNFPTCEGTFLNSKTMYLKSKFLKQLVL